MVNTFEPPTYSESTQKMHEEVRVRSEKQIKIEEEEYKERIYPNNTEVNQWPLLAKSNHMNSIETIIMIYQQLLGYFNGQVNRELYNRIEIIYKQIQNN